MAQAIDDYNSLVQPQITYGLLSDDRIYIELSSETDPEGKCVSSLEIKWEPHFACGSYAPVIKLEAGQIKFLAVRSDILAIFKKMDHGAISMDVVLSELALIGVRRDLYVLPSGALTKDAAKEAEVKKEFDDFMSRNHSSDAVL